MGLLHHPWLTAERIERGWNDNCQGKSEAFRENPASELLCPPLILYELPLASTHPLLFYCYYPGLCSTGLRKQKTCQVYWLQEYEAYRCVMTVSYPISKCFGLRTRICRPAWWKEFRWAVHLASMVETKMWARTEIVPRNRLWSLHSTTFPIHRSFCQMTPCSLSY